MKTIKLSVTDFAVPVIRRGSLTREGLLLGMQLGVDAHKELQEIRSVNPNYKAEHPVQATFQTERFKFVVSGKADGVFFGTHPLVEEIKSSFSIEHLKKSLEMDPLHPYRLQALTYSHILSDTLPGGKNIQTKLTLYSLRNKKQLSLELFLDETYNTWLEQRLSQLEHIYRLRLAQERKRRGIAKTVSFPFENPRPYQDKLMESVSQTVVKGAKALLQAPTGIGKTLGVLFPTMQKTFALGNPIFYLAPKNRQFQMAKESIQQIIPKSRAIKTHVLTAKSKLCRKPRMDCNPDYCEYAKDYYDKVESGRLLDIIKANGVSDQSEFEKIADEYQVCPYQLQMDSIECADIVVADYNYVFSPRAGLAELFKDRPKKDRIALIIDEAHNLYDRASDYFSPRLDLSELISISTYDPGVKLHKKFSKLISDAIDLIESHRPENGRSASVCMNSFALEKIQTRLHSLAIDYFVEIDELWDNDPVLEFYRHWSAFTEVLVDAEEETSVSYIIDGSREYLKITCCDPSKHLEKTYKEFHSVVAFSATLKPFDFYKSMSGLTDARAEEFCTGFPDSNRKVLVIPQVSTMYRSRHLHYKSIAEVIRRVSKVNQGNYLVFFPSYEFLAKMNPHINSTEHAVFCQQKGMTPDQLRELEQALVSDQPSLVLAVQGGALSEGIDLNTPYLKGVFVVGPAIPTISFEREIMKKYYDKKFGDGFSYAYAYPAMTKSIQSSGRVIRSESKQGLIVLLDTRFVNEPYTNAMPQFWFNDSPMELVSKSILADVKNFWDHGSEPTA